QQGPNFGGDRAMVVRGALAKRLVEILRYVLNVKRRHVAISGWRWFLICGYVHFAKPQRLRRDAAMLTFRAHTKGLAQIVHHVFDIKRGHTALLGKGIGFPWTAVR